MMKKLLLLLALLVLLPACVTHRDLAHTKGEMVQHMNELQLQAKKEQLLQNVFYRSFAPFALSRVELLKETKESTYVTEFTLVNGPTVVKKRMLLYLNDDMSTLSILGNLK